MAPRTGFEEMSSKIPGPNPMFKLGIVILALFVAMFLAGKVWESLDADEIMCVQDALDGDLSFATTAGIKTQGFGKITKYYKLETYDFEIPVRFNDAGHATLKGSINFEMPLDAANLTQLHVKYGSQDAIEKQLVQTVVNKCVYMTGPLMSSKESYAEKRTSLIFYIEDQVVNGVYKTLQKDVKTTDPITGVEKTVTVVEIVTEKGIAARQEEAILKTYGIKTSNFAIKELVYDETVENQIKAQQAITMDVQTAIAAAKKAEQNAITVAKEGEANAAKAKWEQEVIKAKMVTEAQQQLEVATLNAKSAEQTKKEQILLGEGEATRKKLVMQADGALNPKLDALIEINKIWADAFGKFQGNLVPSVVMGEQGRGGVASVNDLISLMVAQNAKQVGMDMTVSGRENTAK